MPTKLNNDFDTTQSAITVLFDEHEEDCSLSAFLRGFTGNEGFVDCEDIIGGNTLPDGTKVYSMIADLIANGKIHDPATGRFLFCHYLPVEKFTDQWISSFFEMAKGIRRCLEVEDIGSQRFFVCISLQPGQVPDEEKDAILSRFLRLVAEEQSFVIQPYLLRAVPARFEKRNRRQEAALALLLYLLGRKDYAFFLSPVLTHALKMVDSIEYFQNQTERINQKLDAVTSWESVKRDPELVNLVRDIKGLFPGAIQAELSAERGFQSLQGLFGIPVSSFGGFFHNKRPNVGGDPYLRKRREEYIYSKLGQIVHNVDFRQLRKDLQSYGKLDIEALAEEIKTEKLKTRVFERTEKQIAQSPHRKKLIEDIFEKCVEICNEKVRELPELEKMKVDEERQYRRELRDIVQFSSLEDCLSNLNTKLQVGQFGGNAPKNTRTTVLVSGKVVPNWDIKGYEIRGVDEAYNCPAIATYEKPREVVILKECDILSLEEGFGGTKNPYFIF